MALDNMDNISAIIPNCMLAFNASMFAYDPSPYTSWGIAISAVLWIVARVLARGGAKAPKELEGMISTRLEAVEKITSHTSGEIDYMKRKIDSIANTLQMQQVGR